MLVFDIRKPFFRVLPLEKEPKIDYQTVACNRISLNVKLLKRYLDNSSTPKMVVPLLSVARLFFALNRSV
jgi:hypothetical protein